MKETKHEAPLEHRVRANGLEHRVLEWRGTTQSSPVFLFHGYMDAAGTWDLVAPALAARGHTVFAPDLRGFGDGARVAPGGYYHFADYVADVADLIRGLAPAPGRPVSLVGHSMGGTVATLYAGAFPEGVGRLANLEGLGPPDNAFEVGPTRMRTWIEQVQSDRPQKSAGPMTMEDARRRLAVNHPTVAPEVLDHRLHHLIRAAPGDAQGRVVWRHDPLHRTTSPVPFFAGLFAAFGKKIACPVLFVSGGTQGYHPPDEEARLTAFARLERATLEGAGHMMHWTMPVELATLLTTFLEA